MERHTGKNRNIRRDCAKHRHLRVMACFCAAFLSLFSVVGSCSARTETRGIALLVDEAFAALHPGFLSSLSDLAGKPETRTGGPAPKGKKQAAETPPIAIPDIDRTLDKLLSDWKNDGPAAPEALIASPFVANRLVGKALAGGASLPKLLVPFAGKDLSGKEGVHSIEYDYAAAYAAMGKKAGRYIRNLENKGQTDASCGMVFQPNFMRNEDALVSFTKTFEAEAGANRLSIRILDPQSLTIDVFGAMKGAIDEMTGLRKAVLVLAIDDAFAAEEASAGEAPVDGAGAKKTAAEAHGLVLMADRSTWDESRAKGVAFKYAIWARETALAMTARKIAMDLAAGRPAAQITKVPLRYGSSFPQIF